VVSITKAINPKKKSCNTIGNFQKGTEELKEYPPHRPNQAIVRVKGSNQQESAEGGSDRLWLNVGRGEKLPEGERGGSMSRVPTKKESSDLRGSNEKARSRRRKKACRRGSVEIKISRK